MFTINTPKPVRWMTNDSEQQYVVDAWTEMDPDSFTHAASFVLEKRYPWIASEAAKEICYDLLHSNVGKSYKTIWHGKTNRVVLRVSHHQENKHMAPDHMIVLCLEEHSKIPDSSEKDLEDLKSLENL